MGTPAVWFCSGTNKWFFGKQRKSLGIFQVVVVLKQNLLFYLPSWLTNQTQSTQKGKMRKVLPASDCLTGLWRKLKADWRMKLASNSVEKKKKEKKRPEIYADVKNERGTKGIQVTRPQQLQRGLWFKPTAGKSPMKWAADVKDRHFKLLPARHGAPECRKKGKTIETRGFPWVI